MKFLKGRKKEKAADLFIELGKFIGAGFAIERIMRGFGDYGFWIALTAGLGLVVLGIIMTENKKDNEN